MKMSSKKPYIMRAIYEWIADNGHQPYIMVDTTVEGVHVPSDYIDNGRIVLNVSANAVQDLKIGNQLITFQASFSSVIHMIEFPVKSVLAMTSYESGESTRFDYLEDDDDASSPDEGGDEGSSGSSDRSHLKLID